MKRELQDKLIARFEFLDRKRVNEKYPYPMFGIECGDGWFKLLWELCEKIEKTLYPWRIIFLKEITNSIFLPFKDYKVLFKIPFGKYVCLVQDDNSTHFAVTQIKEKFGGLRFYAMWETDKISRLISKAMDKSYKTCENCGKPGNPNREGWIVTLCKECRKRIND